MLFSVVFDIARVRTAWFVNSSSISAVMSASIAMECLVLLLEAQGKRKFLDPVDQQRSPEEVAGIFNRSLFWWLNHLIKRGFNSVLSPQDLYGLDEVMSSENLNRRFWKTWKGSKSTRKHDISTINLTHI
jgi:ATP-binding cassette subfamily C (CFTR/MRP) protein 1